MKDSIILTDVDGVLLNWNYAFGVWMTQHGWKQQPDANHYYDIGDIFKDMDAGVAKKYTKLFNESAAIGFLPALRDSVYYVRRLHEEHGYRFRCITSLSTDPNAKKLREMNLEKLFGNAIEDVICLETGSPKYDALLPYKDSEMYWIEDHVGNANAGHELGLNVLLMEHGYNMHAGHQYPKVKNWLEIYNLITK